MKFYKTFEIVTPRLILRAHDQSNLTEVHAAMQPVWPELQKWMGWADDGEETMEAMLRNYQNLPAEIAKGHVPRRGFCKNTGKFVVSTGLNKDRDNYETGYWTAKEFLGQGYATEACNAVIRYAFHSLGAKAVVICYYADNEPSKRIIEKLGFTKTGTRPFAQKRCSDGTLMDVHDYEMTDPSVLPPLDVSWRHRCP